MEVTRGHVPAWREDELDSPINPEMRAPYFDEGLGAWIVIRHADILAALHSAALAPLSLRSPIPVRDSADEGRLAMRAETQEALSPSRLRMWSEALLEMSETLIEELVGEEPCELLASYAEPLCLRLAAIVTGIPIGEAEQLTDCARVVSALSANPYDGDLKKHADAANNKLRGCFHAGPQPLRDSGFVAVSQTIPALLGNMWFALMRYPEQWKLVHENPELIEQAVEELLRYAGLVRTVTRVALQDVTIGSVLMREGERIVLRIFAGNRDPEKFADPNKVNLRRRAAGHLMLGAGSHSCVGASLIRMALVAVSRPLLGRFSAAEIVRPISWRGGSGFRSPSTLWVQLKG